MSKVPDFDREQRDFVIHCLQNGDRLSQVTDDIIEMFGYDTDEADSSKVRDTIYRRIQKIKARMPDEDEDSHTSDNDAIEPDDLLCMFPSGGSCISAVC